METHKEGTLAKIITLTAENFKRLVAVRIEPNERGVTVITGKNAAGKSSVLDAVQAALGGGHAAPPRPVREGEDKSVIVCETEDLVVRRSFTAGGGGSLMVTTRDGAPLKSPQAVLDKLYGSLTFDPLEFSRMKPAAKLEEVKRLAGIDLSIFDEARAKAAEKRTEAKRALKVAESKVSAWKPVDAPDEEVNVEDLERERAAAVALVTDREAAAKRMAEMDSERSRVINQIRELVERRDALDVKINAASIALNAMPKPNDPADLKARIDAAITTNTAVRKNREGATLRAELDTAKRAVAEVETEVRELDEERRQRIAAAKLPVPGLTLGDDGVNLNGVPFEQASQAEQLRASLAIGIASNPELRLMLIRDGSLLDEDGLRLVAEMAESADVQVLLEKVGTDGTGAVLIEDGEVAS